MAISDILGSMENNISDAYTTLEGQGATIPEHKNLENLSATISSIPSGGGGVPANMMTTNTDQTGLTGSKTWEHEYSSADESVSTEVLVGPYHVSVKRSVSDSSQDYINECTVGDEVIIFTCNHPELPISYGADYSNSELALYESVQEEQDVETGDYLYSHDTRMSMILPDGIAYLETYTNLTTGEESKALEFNIMPQEKMIWIRDVDENEGIDVGTEIRFDHRDYDNGGSTEYVAYLSDFDIEISTEYGAGSIDAPTYGISFTPDDRTSGSFSLVDSQGNAIISDGTYSISSNQIIFSDSNSQNIGYGALNNHTITVAFNSTIAGGNLAAPMIFCDFISLPQQ